MSQQNDPLEETAPVETHEEWALRRKRERLNVTRFQAKAALLNAGLLDQVQQYIDGTTDPVIQLAWQEASFQRLSNLVNQIGTELGLTDQQLDDLFEQAKGIEV